MENMYPQKKIKCLSRSGMERRILTARSSQISPSPPTIHIPPETNYNQNNTWSFTTFEYM